MYDKLCWYPKFYRNVGILIKSCLVGSNLLCLNFSINNFILQERLLCLLLLGMYIKLSSIVLSYHLILINDIYIWIKIAKCLSIKVYHLLWLLRSIYLFLNLPPLLNTIDKESRILLDPLSNYLFIESILNHYQQFN